MRKRQSVCLMVTNEVSASAFYRGYLSFLRERGWQVAIIASSNGTLHELGVRERVAAHDLQMRRDPAPIQDVVSLLRAIMLLAKLRPEVVVAATPKAGLLGMIAAWVTRVPVRVYLLWGLRLETETGVRQVLFTILERVATALATQVVANSPSLAHEAERLGIAQNIAVLGPGSANGVDVEFFDRARTDIPEPEPRTAAFVQRHEECLTIGYVGRVHRDKGLATLVDAAEICARRGQRINLIIVGPAEDNALEQRLTTQQVPGLEVLLVGAVQDTRPYFRLMDVHCLPTLREGFPNVVLEAASLGIPTITTRATGARDSVVPGLTGLLVDVNDSVQLAGAIEQLATDPSLRERMGENARSHVVQHFSSTAIFALQETNLRMQRELHVAGHVRRTQENFDGRAVK